eukprot:CAMPEP_0177175586 /NCGR_PEP_ID=MMETSP0367-20130122/12789_1 /TAXON_ID=447022 ORGANISM="Scrippsiella hangoei-like, Strain SHHI-4" /NCGR_SAMPLE_ID=MMETSP0367 /ASSEMBLY_ACC=CAM_ASM_000362 /LENGTH=113 /DNA_ID=CAMNT_0018622017 /DNA_START=643 /DNA_END=982 /DNA_ORIENTATION=+
MYTISGSLPLFADLRIAQPEAGKPQHHRFDVVLEAWIELHKVARLDLRDVVLRPAQRLEVGLCRSHGIAPRGAPPHDARPTGSRRSEAAHQYKPRATPPRRHRGGHNDAEQQQ